MAAFMFVKDAAALWYIGDQQGERALQSRKDFRSSKAGTFLDDPDNCRKAR